MFLVGIGILLGPVLGLVTTEMIGDVGAVLASLTLVFILFDSGTDMSIDDLRRYWVGMVQVTLYSFLLSMTVVALMGHYMAGLGWSSSILMGSMVGGTGSAIVIPMVKQMKVSEKTRVVLTLESALSGLLCIVVTLAILEGFKMGQFQLWRVAGTVLASFFMALLLGVLGGMLWAGLLHKVRRLQHSMFLTPAFVFIVYGLTEALGYSGAIAVLAFGLVLGNASYFEFPFIKKLFNKRPLRMVSLEREEKSFFKEMVFILKTFFFVYIGISIPFTDGWALLYGFIIAAAMFVARFVLISVVGRKNTRIDRHIVSIMIPKGLISAVLASTPHQINQAAGHVIIPYAERIECVVYSIIFFSIVICSVLVLFSRKTIINEDYDMSQQQEVYDYE